MGSEQIAILVYPEFTALDALGPHYALAGMMGATVRFVAKTLDPVPCEGASKGGFCVKPHLTFADCPEQLDLLLVPGGLTGTFAAIEDKAHDQVPPKPRRENQAGRQRLHRLARARRGGIAQGPQSHQPLADARSA